MSSVIVLLQIVSVEVCMRKSLTVAAVNSCLELACNLITRQQEG